MLFFNVLLLFPRPSALTLQCVGKLRGIVVSARVSKLPVKVSLRCSSCGAPGTGSCHCGTGYVPAGEYAAKAAELHPELSSRELAKQTGVSQRTAVRALRTAREPFGSTHAVVVGRDGKSYPASKTDQPKSKPAHFDGHSDLGRAKAHIRQTVLNFKQGLTQKDWAALVAWVKEETWETHH